MKSLEYVKEHLDSIEEDDILDRRFTKRLMSFLPVEEWEKYGFTLDDNATPIPTKEWTEENVLAQLRDDLEFGIDKAVNHRGISASLMYNVVMSWCKVLENGLENTGYGYYGCDLFKAVDAYYNFGLVDEHTFDEEFYKEW